MHLRTATAHDIPALIKLIDASARALSVGYYTEAQIEAAVRHVFGVDSQLIRDGTYYVIEERDRLVAAGGWSARRTLYGGDQAKERDDPALDPATDAARIRAFFVHPDRARRGLARRLYEHCAAAAWSAGFRRFELMSTRPGEPLYQALGFVPVERVVHRLPGDIDIDFTRMSRPIDQPALSSELFRNAMTDAGQPELLSIILDSWDRSNRMLVNLLRLMPEGGLAVRVVDDGPSIAELFTHIHFVRLVFIDENAPDLRVSVPAEEWLHENDADVIAQMLSGSAEAVRTAVQRRVETGQRMNQHYDHPVLMLQHMLWHEGYHHGQIKLALKIAGSPIADQVAGPATWDILIKRWTAHDT